jgi:hypothetical protein
VEVLIDETEDDSEVIDDGEEADVVEVLSDETLDDRLLGSTPHGTQTGSPH